MTHTAFSSEVSKKGDPSKFQTGSGVSGYHFIKKVGDKILEGAA